MPNDYDAEISAGGQVAAAAISYASAAQANRRGRRWALEQYNRERTDALTDRAMMNDYNSPAAQMERLKAAGLNPNLVYGDGNATMASAQTRSASSDTYKPQANKLDLQGAGQSLMAGVALKNTEQQTDNLKVQQDLLRAQIDKTIAETLSTGTSTQRSEFDLQQLKARATTDLEQVKANLQKTYVDTEKTRTDTQYTLDQNERSALMNKQSLQLGIESIISARLQQEKTKGETQETQHRIQLLETQRDNLKTSGVMSEIDLALKKQGINPHDPAYIRWAQRIMDLLPGPELEPKLRKILNDIKNKVIQNQPPYPY